MQFPTTLYVLSDSDLNKFRTKRCVKHEMNGMCPNGEGCFDIHCDRNDWNDESFIRPNNSRRPPFASLDRREIKYLNVLCNKVNPNAKAKSVDSSKCKYGHECPYCHTWEEYLYHPMNYKVMMCQSVNSGKRCTDAFCSSFHTHDDVSQRPNQRWLIRVRKNINLADVPQNVEVVTTSATKKKSPNFIDGILYNRKQKPVKDRTRRYSMSDPYVGNYNYDFAHNALAQHINEDDFRMTYKCENSLSETKIISYPQLQDKPQQSIVDVTDTSFQKHLKTSTKKEQFYQILSPASATTIANSPSCSSIYSV